MSEIIIKTKGRKKPKLEVSINGLKVLQCEDMFRAKRDAQLLKKLDDQKDLLHHWFANTHPDHSLKVHLILSRKSEELEVRKELKFYKNNPEGGVPSMIAMTDTVYSHTWYSPLLMERYVDSFLKVNQEAIDKIIRYRETHK